MDKPDNNSIFLRGRKLYLFAAVALAVFVFVMAMGRLRSGQTVATAELRHEVPSGTPDNSSMRAVECGPRELQQVQQSITADEFVRKLLVAMSEETRQQLDDSDQQNGPINIDALSNRFEVSLGNDSGEGLANGIAIRVLHPDGQVARNVVNLVANQFAKQEHVLAEASLYRNPHEEAKQAASIVKSEWKHAQESLSAFLKEHGDPLEWIRAESRPATATEASTESPEITDEPSAVATATESEAATDGPWLADPTLVGGRYARQQIDRRAAAEGIVLDDTNGTPAPTTEQPVRDDMTRLDRDLEELQRIKIEQLSRLTPDHPQVRELNGRIDELTARLTRIRARMASQSPTVKIESTVEETAVFAAEPTAPVTISEQEQTARLAEHQRLQDAVIVGEREYRRLAAVERTRWLQKLDERRVPRWRVTEADRATLRHESTSPTMTIVALLMGMTAGFGLLTVAGVQPTGFTTVEQAEQTLPVPVVGALPAEHPTAAQPNTRRRVTRTLLLVCEVSLVLFLLAMILAVILDGDFAHTLRKDPLAALADGWHHLWSLWTR